MIKNKIKLLLVYGFVTIINLTAQVTHPEPGKPYFLLHSSGLVVSENNDGRATIQPASGATNQYVQFVSDNAGYYWIKLEAEQKFIARTGNWDTYFITDSTSDNSKFAIEIVSDVFIRLRCKANDKYLGTDNTTPGSYLYADKNGTDSKHYWYISEQETELPVDSSTTVINPSALYDKPFEGWGVSLCWWANMCGKWDEEKIDEVVDWLVSPDGLNYNIFRYNIGGGDDPLNQHCTPHHMAKGKGIRAEMEGFKDSSDGDYIWSRDAAQRKIMLKIKEKRPDAIFEAFSNSAPYYMTYSGCVAGNVDPSKNNLKPEYYKEFAHYLVDVCKFYKDSFDIEFKTLDPFNEPVTNYWGANGGQEGCHFSTIEQIKFLKILAPVLKESTLTTLISASDETSTTQSLIDFNAYIDDGEVLDLVGQWNTHTYSATHQSRANIRALATAHNKTLWMSETGAGGNGLSGNLDLAQRLMDDIRYLRPEAWVDWQYIEEWNDQWCLVQGDFAAQRYWRVKNFYVRQQFSKYILKGSTFLYVPNDKILAALSPDKSSLIVVALNNSALKTVHELNLSMVGETGPGVQATRTSETEDGKPVTDFEMANNSMYITLPANSISTYVIPLNSYQQKEHALIPNLPYLIFGRTSALNLQAINSGVYLQTFIENEPAQVWKLHEAGSGFTLTNGLGEAIIDRGSYYAVATSEEQNGRIFRMEAVGDGCYKIVSESTGKVLDMESGNNTENTRIGFWDYGGSPAASHRQWIFYPLASPDTTTTIAQVYNQATNVKIYGGDASIFVLQHNEQRGILQVYDLNGSCIFHDTISQPVTQIPAPAGIFIVRHTSIHGEVCVGKIQVG